MHHGEKTHRVSGSSLGLSLERCSHYGGTHYGRESGVKRTTAQYIPIAAFTANGDLEKLRTALSAGLDAGLTVNEIKEILVQMYAYVGFPRSLTHGSLILKLPSKNWKFSP